MRGVVPATVHMPRQCRARSINSMMWCIRMVSTVTLLVLLGGWPLVGADDTLNTAQTNDLAEAASSTSCDSLQRQLERVTQDWSYCRATSSATEIRERMLLEKVERMEEEQSQQQQQPPITTETCTTDSVATEQVQTLEATVAQLQNTLQTSEKRVEQMTLERSTMQLTLDDMHEQLTALQASLKTATVVQEQQNQLLQTQHDQVVAELTLMRQRLREAEHQQEQEATLHQLEVERVRTLGEQTGRSSSAHQVHFWVAEYNRQRTAQTELTHQRNLAQEKLVAVQGELFDLRRAWHGCLERDRTALLRRQLLVQSLVVEPWQYLCVTVLDHPVWVWLDHQPLVMALRDTWQIVVHQHFPVGMTRVRQGMNSARQTVVETLDLHISPLVSASWEATKEPREQAWTAYETVVLPSPVFQTVLKTRDSAIRFLSDVLVIAVHTIFPQTLTKRRQYDHHLDASTSAPAAPAWERLLQFVEDRPEDVVVGVPLVIVGIVLVSFMRSARRRKPKIE